MVPIDMSDEDASKFDAHKAAFDKFRATPKGSAFLAAVESIALEAASDIAEVAKVLAPLALEVGKAALVSLATSALEKELSKLQK